MIEYRIPIEIVEQIVYDYLEDLIKTQQELTTKLSEHREVVMEANEVISACEDVMDYLRDKELYKFAEEL